MNSSLQRECTLIYLCGEVISLPTCRLAGVGDGNRTHSKTGNKALTGSGWHSLERTGINWNSYWTRIGRLINSIVFQKPNLCGGVCL